MGGGWLAAEGETRRESRAAEEKGKKQTDWTANSQTARQSTSTTAAAAAALLDSLCPVEAQIPLSAIASTHAVGQSRGLHRRARPQRRGSASASAALTSAGLAVIPAHSSLAATHCWL